MPFSPELDRDVELDLGVPAAVAAGPVAPEDVLARVKAEGLRRRNRRHRRNAVVAALALAAFAVPVVSLLPGEGDDEVTVAAEGGGEADGGAGSSRDAGRERTTPTTEAALEPVLVPGGTESPATTAGGGGETVATAVPPPATAPAPACRNSTDPACGEFRWDPAPEPNDPLVASFVDPPSTVPAGQPVTFRVQWSDPEAGLTYDSFVPDSDVQLGPPCRIERRYGPWTPPAATASGGELTYTHTFDTPGEHPVSVLLASGTCDGPYYNELTINLTVTVV